MLPALLQLVSPALPVGSYSYSQGLEWAVSAGLVRDEGSAGEWIGTVLEHGVAACDATVVAELMRAWADDREIDVARINEFFVASRESRELHAETLQMGRSMLDVLRDVDDLPPPTWRLLVRLRDSNGVAYPTAWTAAAASRRISVPDAVTGFLWAWLENAVLAAIKCVPLGQRAGQRLLSRFGERIPALTSAATVRQLDDCRNLLPGLSLASMQHETQYTRLFRS
ncbi:MAG: urease accessory protein UreF [Proteobacteria bacterium]|nr:urease accessory protein UreF [Pseudomonadota bacterium]